MQVHDFYVIDKAVAEDINVMDGGVADEAEPVQDALGRYLTAIALSRGCRARPRVISGG
jgi:hypothetical protein